MLTRTGWAFAAVAAVSLVVGLTLSYRELVMVGLAMVCCLLFAIAWLLLRPAVEVTRAVIPDRVTEGEGAAGVLTVRNTAGRRSPPMLALEAFAGDFLELPLPSLAPGMSYTGNYLLPASRRGCYSVGPLQISHSDPLRLMVSTQSLGNEVILFVHPRIHHMSPVPTGHSQDLEGPTSASAPRGGIAFHSLREYEPGDDLRLIHWRSSARLDKLMVRHTVITNEPNILVLLDTSEEPYEEDSFEDAVRVAASLVVACVDRRFPTEFRTTGGVSGHIDPTGAGLTDVLDKMSAIGTRPDDPGLPSLLKTAARRSQGVSMAAVSGQVDPQKAQVVGAVRGRYQMSTFVQVGERFGRPGLSIPGVLCMSADTSEGVARLWRTRVGS
jgi:uncharacterized protein (DUF58 family)